jgi:hypothetical protein
MKQRTARTVVGQTLIWAGLVCVDQIFPWAEVVGVGQTVLMAKGVVEDSQTLLMAKGVVEEDLTFLMAEGVEEEGLTLLMAKGVEEEGLTLLMATGVQEEGLTLVMAKGVQEEGKSFLWTGVKLNHTLLKTECVVKVAHQMLFQKNGKHEVMINMKVGQKCHTEEKGTHQATD